MNGWPTLSPQERIAVAAIGGCAERRFTPMRDDAEFDEISRCLHRVPRDRRRLILAMAAQRYVDEPHMERVAGLLELIGADLDEARRYRAVRLADRGFDPAAMADAIQSAKAPDKR